jgi:DNA-binding MarR family transcriptional regulator
MEQESMVPVNLEEDLGMLVARARKGMRREFELHLAPYDLTLPQVVILILLSQNDGQTISQLGTAACSDGPTLTSLLDRLETKGLIYRERDRSDRRAVRIHLHPAGRAMRLPLREAHERLMSTVLDGLTSAQVRRLCELLMRLCRTLENAHDSGPVFGNFDLRGGEL